jgi:hypothetical protein
MKKINFYIIILLLIVIAENSFALQYKDGDFQYWQTTSIDAKAKNGWKITMEEEIRFADDVGSLSYHHSDIGLVYSGLAKWLVVGGNYRLVFGKKGKTWTYENRPHINVTFKGDYKGFKISNRIRVEYRDKESSKDGWRLRNKTTVKYPMEIKGVSLIPYIADEFNADFIVSEINRNRVYAGVGFKLMEHLTLDLYYLWESNFSSSKKTLNFHVLGTKIKVSF